MQDESLGGLPYKSPSAFFEFCHDSETNHNRINQGQN